MELTSNHIGEAVACHNPDCVDEHGNRSVAEPEQDGDHSYHTCTVCGDDFGWHRTDLTAVSPDGSCVAGIPEHVRRAASAGMENALAADARQQLPLLRIGRRPDATTA